jgi:hypothetical protein
LPKLIKNLGIRTNGRNIQWLQDARFNLADTLWQFRAFGLEAAGQRQSRFLFGGLGSFLLGAFSLVGDFTFVDFVVLAIYAASC